MAFQKAWIDFWILKRRRGERFRLRLLVATLLGLGLGAFFILVLITGVDGEYGPNWWLKASMEQMAVGLFIAYAMLAQMLGLEACVPEHLLERISVAQDWRYGSILGAISAIAAAAGDTWGRGLVDWFAHGNFLEPVASRSPFDYGVAVFLIVIASMNLLWWRIRLRRQTLRHQATEAQLRLLQAQIEPHFLFNTLANVQSLMDHDPVRARQLLERFTDYLRASLGQLRQSESSLATELAMARNYLQLLKLRMEDRLEFVIDASEEAGSALLPTLLLQPLIENAIQHGLEPKVEGGKVEVKAQVKDGRLHISVLDDGLGLEGASRSLRRGSGMALENLRARLHARYGPCATLTLSSNPTKGEAFCESGTCVVLDLPYEGKP